MSSRGLGRRAWLGLLLGALLLAGCEDSPSLLPIDSIVEFRLSEDTGRVLINAQTQRLYSCSGYQIIHKDFNQTGFLRPTFRIDLLGIQAPSGTCPAVTAPATGVSSFLLPSIGNHNIQITANGIVATAVLQVTADSLIVTGGNSTWTLWPEPRVARP